MDDAAARVDPVPLRALMRLRERREESALREVRAGLAACERAEQARAQAQEAVQRHETLRAEREAGLIASLRSALQTADKILLARDHLERLAERAVRLDDELSGAVRSRAAADAELARARCQHAEAVRRREKWRRTLDRVQTARAAHHAAAEEAELEDEAADRLRPQARA